MSVWLSATNTTDDVHAFVRPDAVAAIEDGQYLVTYDGTRYKFAGNWDQLQDALGSIQVPDSQTVAGIKRLRGIA